MTQPTTTETIPGSSDDRDERDQLSMFGRCGQLALPGASAQLGLDGAAYALDPIDASATAEASRSLGPHTEFSHESVLHPSDRLPGSPLQLALDLEAWEAAPQLTLWQRLQVVHDMVRESEWDRDAKCNRTRFSRDADVDIARTERGAWSTAGTIKCCTWQTCPSCGPRKCRETASMLSVAFARHMQRDGECDAWMLSLTVPHYADESAELAVDHLYDADAHFVRSPEWRTFVKRWGVVGRVRVLDATHGGANGAHPHFHIALFVEKSGLPTEHAFLLGEPREDVHIVDERGDVECNGVRVMHAEMVRLHDERDRWGVWKPLRACSQNVRRAYLDEIKGSLVPAWERAVRAAGARIERLTEFRRKSVELTPSENAAAYFTKWGLADEIGATSSKTRSALRLLDAVAAGVKGAAYSWKQWRRAIHGHALVTGLTKIVERLGVTEDDAREWLDEQRRRREAELEREGTPVVKVPELALVVRSHLYGAAMALGWDRVFSFIDERALVGHGETSDWLQRALDDFLWSNLALSRGPPDG